MPNMVDYDKTYAEFKFEVPEYFNFARDVFDKWDPNSLAMFWVDDDGNEAKRTFGELTAASNRAANMLRNLGVKRGDVVVVVLPRLIEWWEINLACLRLGAVISPGTTQLTPKDLKYRFEASGATCMITDAANAPKVDEIRADCPAVKSFIIVGDKRDGWVNYGEAVAASSPEFTVENTRSDENAILYFTSGTTGYPKMTVHTHASYPIGHQATGKFWLDLTPNDLHWNLSDTGWAKAAWSSFYGPWNCGAALFVHHTAKFDVKKTLEYLAKYPVTTLCGPPTAYRMFVLEDLSKYKFPTLRHCVGAGEPLNPEIIEVWEKATGLKIRDGYGQTETVILAGTFPPLEVKAGSMGKPTPGFDVRVIDEEGNEVPRGKEGDIAVRVKPNRPVGLFKEYWKNPEKTAGVYRGDFYVTGDRAVMDEDGYLWFVGRADDVILASGYRIGPFEVESALLEHPAVAESAVVSSPDETRGEVVKAFVILAPGYQGSPELVKELQDYVKKVTAPYKYPRKIEFVDSLPKTVSGKIRRIELREKEWAGWKK
ncbi:MAG: AMP-binding protein [Firmicutes bacterium]|nr:AMP-binding protein [Bacillota bacterium]